MGEEGHFASGVTDGWPVRNTLEAKWPSSPSKARCPRGRKAPTPGEPSTLAEQPVSGQNIRQIMQARHGATLAKQFGAQRNLQTLRFKLLGIHMVTEILSR